MSDESLFREVDEEVRQEQYKKLWDRYGNLIIAVCLLVVAGVAGYKGWQYWELKQSQAAGESFFAAVKQAGEGKAGDAAAAFDKIGHSGYGTLARLREAAALASDGKTDDAVKIYDAVAADSAIDTPLRDLARVRAALVLADKASAADLETRVKPLDVADNPWRHAAREILAAAHWRASDYAAVDAQVKTILGDASTPPGVRQRAEMLSELLVPVLAKK